MQPVLTIIMCAYNEMGRIQQSLDELCKILDRRHELVEVLVLDNCSSDGTREWLRTVRHPCVKVELNERNLGKGGSIKRGISMSGGRHVVIHAAAVSDVRAFMKDPVGTMETIVEGTKAVLAAAAPTGVEAFLFVSSGAVYGHQPHDRPRLSEDDRGGPDLRDSRSCYAEAKRCAELLCQLFRERQGVPVMIARPFTLVGPYQDLNATSAVIDFIRQGLEGMIIRIRDDGQAIRSYCYIADAVTALWKLLLGPQTGEAVNVGSDLEPVSFHELAQRVGHCLAKPVTVVVEGAAASGVLGRRYVPDVSRLERVTGFRPGTGLDRALNRTIAWMREQRATSVPTL